MSTMEISAQSTTYGNQDLQFRVWVVRGRGWLDYYHVSGPTAALEIIDALDGPWMAFGLEEHYEGDWHEWYNDDADDIEDLYNNRED